MGRIDKVNQRIKKEIGLILQREVEDPRLQFVTITAVEVTRDLQHAKVFYSVLGDKTQSEQAAEGLLTAKGLIRRFLGQRLKIRYTPDIEFEYDNTIAYSAFIDQKLEDLKHERE